METRVTHRQMTYNQMRALGKRQQRRQRKKEKDRARKLLENENGNTATNSKGESTSSIVPKKAGGPKQIGKKRKAERLDAESDSDTSVEFILNKSDRTSKKRKSLQTPNFQRGKERRHRHPKSNPWLENPSIPQSPIRIYHGANAGDIEQAARERRQNRRLQGYHDYEGEPGEKLYFYEGYGRTDEAGREAMEEKIKERIRKFYLDYPEAKRKEDVCGLYGIEDSEWEGSDEGNHLNSMGDDVDYRLIVDDEEGRDNENKEKDVYGLRG